MTSATIATPSTVTISLLNPVREFISRMYQIGNLAPARDQKKVNTIIWRPFFHVFDAHPAAERILHRVERRYLSVQQLRTHSQRILAAGRLRSDCAGLLRP